MARKTANSGSIQRWSQRDSLAVLTLLATAFVLGLPVLKGGWLTYLDNAAHLAEIHALASDDGRGGWAHIGFCGLSLDNLHSPPLWRALALLSSAGVPLAVPYAFLVCLSLCAPAVALYAVARKRCDSTWAFLLAYTMLIQRPAITGSASATGGMWTFYLASGALVCYADALAKPPSHPFARGRARSALPMAALLGCIGLTHLFALAAAALLTLSHLACTLVMRDTDGANQSDPNTSLRYFLAAFKRAAFAAALGALCSAWYWLPTLAAGVKFQRPQNLHAAQLLELLALPLDVFDVLGARTRAPALPAWLEALPLALVLLVGVLGMLSLRRRTGDPLAASGAVFALFVLALLFVARPLELTLLGPVSWRFLYFVRIGCALAGVQLLSKLPIVRLNTIASAGMISLTVASGLLWNRTLARDTASIEGPEMRDVRALWAWLKEHHDASWGRVYLEDTAHTPPFEAALSLSHVLALTKHEAHVEPLGPYYGVVPAATALKTLSEFGRLFGLSSRDRERLGELRLAAQLYGVTHVVTAESRWEAALSTLEGVERKAAIGRFTVFHLPEAAGLALSDVPDAAVEVTRPSSGRLHLRVKSERTSNVLLKESYHAFWELEGDVGSLTRHPTGLMVIAGLPAGTHELDLRYAPPRGTFAGSLVGWLILLLVWARERCKTREAAATRHQLSWPPW